jgi:hypothetical protein
LLLEMLLDIAIYELGRLACFGEGEGLCPLFHEECHEPDGIVRGAAASELIIVGGGGIPEDEMFFSARSSIVLDGLHGTPHKPLGQLGWIGDGRAGRQENRLGTIVAADSLQSAEDAGHVGSENASVEMDFIDDNITQAAEESRPLGMVGEYGGMQHVGIGQYQVGFCLDAAALRSGSIAVVDAGTQTTSGLFVGRNQVQQTSQLILSERLGGKEIQRPCRGIVPAGLENGEVIAERLAASRSRDDNPVVTLPSRIEGGGLMGIEISHSPRFEQPL